MGYDEPLSYGIIERRKIIDEIDVHLEEIDRLGFTMIPDAFDADFIAELRASIDHWYAEQAIQGDAGDLGAESDLLRCPLAYDDAFLRVATQPSLLELARRALGEPFVLLQQNAIINRPDRAQHQSRWHRDLPYQHFVSSRRIAINALLCVDDFTFETGGTMVLPGSHKFEEFPSARFVQAQEQVANAASGSMIVMDSMLFHRAGSNISAGTRRGVNHILGRPMLSQQVDLPRLLGPRHADDPFLAGFLGYRWNPASDVQAWRDRRR